MSFEKILRLKIYSYNKILMYLYREDSIVFDTFVIQNKYLPQQYILI